MKKFGFGKKSEGDDDSSRAALFGSRSKTKSPAPAANPYAQAPLHSDPYAAAKSKAYGGAPPPVAGSGLPSGPKAGGMNQPPSQMGAPNNPYGGKNGSGYGPGRQGAFGGYGGDQNPGNNHAGSGSRYGPGGYGGLGNTDPNLEDNRNNLFGDAGQRLRERQQQHPQGAGNPPPYAVHEGSGMESGAPGTTSGGYGAYQERQLTAEEEEEEDVQAMKQDIRFMKQQDVSSTRNALRIAAEAEETGRSTLARLGAQGERIHNTEKNLDLAANQNRIADEKSRELKTLNKSMFAMHVGNPFTSSDRRKARDEQIIDRHHEERLQREETRMAAFRTDQRMGQTFKDMEKKGQSAMSKNKANLAERSKYQFEQDSEDDEMENEIDSNLDALHGAAVRLNGLARATGKELEEQNKRLDVIMGKSDSVDDQIHMNRARLDRIR